MASAAAVVTVVVGTTPLAPALAVEVVVAAAVRAPWEPVIAVFLVVVVLAVVVLAVVRSRE